MKKTHKINNKLNALANSLMKNDSYPNKYLNSIQLYNFNTDRVNCVGKNKRGNSELTNIIKILYKNNIPNTTILKKNLPGAGKTIMTKERKVCNGAIKQKGIEPKGIEPKGIEPKGIEPRGIEPKGIEALDDNIFKTNYFHSVNNNIRQFFDEYINIKINIVENIYFGFCLAVNPKFHIYDDDTKLNFMMSLKKNMAIDLEKKDLYRKLGYNKKRAFKRSVFETQLFENDKNIGKIFYKYLGDYFDLNFLIIENSNYIYCNDYNDRRMSIVLHKIDSDIFINLNIKGVSLIHPNKIKVDKNRDTLKPMNSSLNKKTLTELQESAKKYNIKILKPGKSKMINKTKSEIIKEIENLINK